MNERILFIKSYPFFKEVKQSAILSILMDIKPIEYYKG